MQLETIGNYDKAAWRTWEQRIQLYLEGRVPRINRLIQGSFGRESKGLGFEFPFGSEQHDVDFDSVLADPGFQDMVTERWYRVWNNLGNVRGLKQQMQEIVGIIDLQLDR